ncbi:NADPH-dependent assimilatory sulfite reductase hemoprotein subunit [Geothrix sp. PMB-07]|uniref:NADPH-dependent assimilatory sulfite reductase hemoprotein subunit n=1 Tax=Geothrix sp. PMB-07 TaxID=3068640 RepID=UPI00274131EC|nr:NADPH-dependent assimilatory sulfite reductase hemoprotein subunit [Geothrix sp. PMB-07]WLT31194.1 NADPH-dependent assimilatory sulfite reductase hemoprotein subunit [Geothrix sp. PMB-07]
MSTPSAEHPVEALKRESRHLRGTLAEELAGEAEGFSKDSETLLKFHGLYQQKNRDKAPETPKHPVLMVRGRIPGGRLEASQYLAWDRIADIFADGSLRITTRQSLELHGVVKGDAKAVLQGLHAALQTTQGACGDVVRNVTQAPNPWGRADLAQLDAVALQLSNHFRAHAKAYAEVWLDGEKVDTASESEPVLGDTYLPRKFKISVTAAGENAVDVYTNDLAFAATFKDGAEGTIDGYFVLAGGGMGMTHNDATTFPRLADLLGWIPADAALKVAEAVVGVHRDHGNRGDRRRARLKYVVAQKGLAWLRAEVEARAGLIFTDRDLPPWRTTSTLGWLPRTDGTWALGLHTLSGRVAGPLKAALRELVERFQLGVQFTPDQDAILIGIPEAAKDEVAAFFQARGLGIHSPAPLFDRALACVALPYCGLAITEAERALPELLEVIQTRLEDHGLADRAPVFRVAGCANGCSRPYAAEFALVGQTPGKYALYLGGHVEGTRMAQEVLQKVSIEALGPVLDELFTLWKAEGQAGERLGDFSIRFGLEALKQRLEVPL